MVRGELVAGGHRVGPGNPAVVVGEIGVNHNGDLDLALAMIREAAASGADIVKFQTYHPERFVTPEAPKAVHQLRDEVGDDQISMLRRMSVPNSWYPCLMKVCAECGVGFLSTAYEEQALEVLLEAGVDAIKTDSANLTNLRFLEVAAATGLPMLVSVGMGTTEEIDAAVGVLRTGKSPFMLLHCVSSYPAPVDQLDLRMVLTLSQAYQVPVGYSDHCSDPIAATVAVSLGACLIEKHFTTDKGLPGPDQAASADPQEFRDMVQQIRLAERALGQALPRLRECERESREKMRRSLCTASDLPAGHVVTPEDLQAMRPGWGIPPSSLGRVVGKRLVHALAAHRVLAFSDLTGREESPGRPSDGSTNDHQS